MDKKEYQLLYIYKGKSFTETKNSLYKQFFLYILILLGFSLMSISFFNKVGPHQIIVFCVLLPMLYLILKSIYGLILLHDSYKPYHYYLIREFCLLYIIGYNIILFSFTHLLLYCYESFFIVFLIFLLKRFKSALLPFLTLLALLTGFYFSFNLFYFMMNFFLTMALLIPLIYKEKAHVKNELQLIELGLKNHPQGRIEDFIKIS